MEKNHNSTLLVKLAYIYITLPFLIFALGWLKNILAIPVLLILLGAISMMFKDAPALWTPQNNTKNRNKLLLIAIILLIWVLLSGIGGYSFQNLDHFYRNAMFDLMVSKPWPILNTIPTETLPQPVAFIYYIGFWLPAALVGKLFGLSAGYFAQALWAWMGIALFYGLIVGYRKKLALWPLVLFILFSGLDIIGILGTPVDHSTLNLITHIEWWSWPYQFSSMTTQLFWVFNQAIPIWIITMLILLQKNNKNIILLLALSMLASTLPFIGLLPIAGFFMLTGKDLEEKAIQQQRKPKARFLSWAKETLTFENTVAGGAVGILSYLFLRENNAGQLLSTTNREFPTFWSFAITLGIFLLLEVGLYFLAIAKYQYKNKLFYLTLISLICIPVIKIGFAGDFAMRASIPALILLFLLVVDTLTKAKMKKDWMVVASVLTLLALGSITPFMEINRTVVETYQRIVKHKTIPAGSADLINEPAENFWGDLEGNLFFTYLAK